MRTKETYFQNKEKRITHIRYTLGMSADSLISVLLLKWFAVQKKKKAEGNVRAIIFDYALKYYSTEHKSELIRL